MANTCNNAPALACFSGPKEPYNNAIIGVASIYKPALHGSPMIKDNLTPVFDVSFNFFLCFFVYASVIAGTSAIAIAVENTCGKLIKVCAVPLSSPYKSAICISEYPITDNLVDTKYESISPIRGAMEAPIVIGTAMYNNFLAISKLLSTNPEVDNSISFFTSFFVKLYRTKINIRDAIYPAEAPKVAPAAASSNPVLTKAYAKYKPTATLKNCSIICEYAIGVIFCNP